MPGETEKRHGQAIAAASLPERAESSPPAQGSSTPQVK